MHNYIMLPLTMLANLTMSTLFTYESRRALNTRYRLYLFNLISFVTTLLMFAISAIGGSFSLYSVLFGFGFGAAIVLGNRFISIGNLL